MTVARVRNPVTGEWEWVGIGGPGEAGIPGPPGADGDPGPQGPPGVGIPVDIQIFENTRASNLPAFHEWIKPEGARTVQAIVIGGGGGGGSGRRGATTTGRSGGGGGGGGGWSEATFAADSLPATCEVVVGWGGAGGLAVATDTTSGAAGSFGGASQFREFADGGFADMRTVFANGGDGGAGGGTGAITAANGAAGGYALHEGGVGGPTLTTNKPATPATAIRGGGGGGGGGSLSTSNVAQEPGDGANTNFPTAYGGNAPSHGVNTGQDSMGFSGGGGAAGGYSLPAGQGTSPVPDAGLWGGGGGGGAASSNGYPSGAGGKGAPGVVVVITYF